MENTQIQVSKKTRQVLKSLKLVKKESYEEVILRLIQSRKNFKILTGGKQNGN